MSYRRAFQDDLVKALLALSKPPWWKFWRRPMNNETAQLLVDSYLAYRYDATASGDVTVL